MNKIALIVGTIVLLAAAVGAVLFFRADATARIMAEEDAVETIIEVHPELETYKTTSLPPSSIITKQLGTGWYVAFIESGSGVSGILTARCYRVSETTRVEQVGTFTAERGQPAERMQLETCSPIFGEEPTSVATTTNTQPGNSGILPYGNTTLRLGERAQFPALSVTPVAIEEDSRCPSDVQCIQAGTVRVKVEFVSAAGTTTGVLKLDEVLTTKAESITLMGVEPGKISTATTSLEAYRFTIKVVPQGLLIKPKTVGECFVGGCSSQICSDTKDAVSTCEFKEEYACYKTAACERQRDGACGWTLSAALTACLATASRSTIAE